MEKEGFVRGMGICAEYELAVETLVTDRHKQLPNGYERICPKSAIDLMSGMLPKASCM